LAARFLDAAEAGGAVLLGCIRRAADDFERNVEMFLRTPAEHRYIMQEAKKIERYLAAFPSPPASEQTLQNAEGIFPIGAW
jgi:hypothetical protein